MIFHRCVYGYIEMSALSPNLIFTNRNIYKEHIFVNESVNERL